MAIHPLAGQPALNPEPRSNPSNRNRKSRVRKVVVEAEGNRKEKER